MKMVFLCQLTFIIFIVFSFNVETKQKEVAVNHGEDDDFEWMKMKWDSIFVDPHSDTSDTMSVDDSHEADDLLISDFSNKRFKSNSKLSDSELNTFSEDEVFIESNDSGKSTSSMNSVESMNKGKDDPEESESPNERNSDIKESQDIEHELDEKSEDSDDETISSESSMKLESSQTALAGSKEISEKDLLEESDSPSKRNFGIKENQDVELDEVDVEGEDSEDETTVPESSLELENSQTALDGSKEISNAEQPNSEFLSQRSFIFNPMAGAQEQFQNCTTPKNESGTCRYLQHCLIPTVIASLNQFMDYVCIIEGRFIGVCCPHNPVTTVVVKDQNETAENESELNENCGVATNTRVVGGMNADPKAYPWMVALLSKSRKFFCGGSLINNRYVLTAAHCTFDIPQNEIIARVGEYDFKDDGETHEEYAVVEMKRHGHYNRRTLANDIALLKLEKPVNFNQFVKTICFPEEENDYVGENATLTGWGNTSGGGKTSDVLQQATFPVISNDECSKKHGLPVPEFLICSASLGKDKGGCNGDSGGPLMLLDKNDRWKVIGLVSWGRRGCSPDFPTVYTRVSHYLDWIEEHAK